MNSFYVPTLVYIIWRSSQGHWLPGIFSHPHEQAAHANRQRGMPMLCGWELSVGDFWCGGRPRLHLCVEQDMVRGKKWCFHFYSFTESLVLTSVLALRSPVTLSQLLILPNASFFLSGLRFGQNKYLKLRSMEKNYYIFPQCCAGLDFLSAWLFYNSVGTEVNL